MKFATPGDAAFVMSSGVETSVKVERQMRITVRD
jgi:hypothetical protein